MIKSAFRVPRRKWAFRRPIEWRSQICLNSPHQDGGTDLGREPTRLVGNGYRSHLICVKINFYFI